MLIQRALYWFVILLVGYVVFTLLWFGFFSFLSRGLLAETTVFSHERGDAYYQVLVVGDSTALGVGAVPTQSIPGLVAGLYGDAQIEVVAESGAHLRDVPALIQKATKTEYDLILIQAGANDIVSVRSWGDIENDIRKMNTAAQTLLYETGAVVWMHSGSVGYAPVFWFPLDFYLHNRSRTMRDLAERLEPTLGFVYVDLFHGRRSDDPLVLAGSAAFARDKFHPSSLGYSLWFERVSQVIDNTRALER